MEESISSSRTSTAFYCNNDGYYGHGITAAASEDSGWTAYFDDFLQASREEPAPARKKLHHGVSATASTLSSSANRKKAVKEKKKPRSFELEDPLQDTASSPANATQLQAYISTLPVPCMHQVQVDAWTLYGRSQQGMEMEGFYQTMDVWGITSRSEQIRPPSVQQWSAGDVNGIGMGLVQQQEAANECYTELQKGGVYLV